MDALRARRMWLDEVQGTGGSSATTRAYSRHTLEALQDIARERGVELETLTIEGLERSDILAALNSYRSRPDLRGGRETTRAESSVERRLAALRAWLGWLVKQEQLERNVAATIQVKVPQGQRQSLGVEAFKQLLETARQGRSPSRDRVVLLLSGTTGLKISEIAALTLEDVDVPGGTVHIRGRRERTLGLPTVVKESIEEYLKVRERTVRELDGDPGTLLVTGSAPDGKYTAAALNAHLTRVLRSAGIKGPGVTPHSLRAGFAASALLERVLTPGEVRAALGSKSLPETPVVTREKMLETHPFAEAAKR